VAVLLAITTETSETSETLATQTTLTTLTFVVVAVSVAVGKTVTSETRTAKMEIMAKGVRVTTMVGPHVTLDVVTAVEGCHP
jgi:hypothetical protein